MLEILHVTEQLAAVNINSVTYYIRLDMYMPEVYDENENRLSISNINTWIANQTQNNYTFRSLIENCYAFYEGYNKNFSNKKFDQLIEYVVLKTKNEIFMTNLAGSYASEYWIECTPKEKISSKLLNPILKKQNNLANKLGLKTMSEYLNRIKRIVSEKTDIKNVEKIMQELDIKTDESCHPDTSELDKALISRIKSDIKYSNMLLKVDTAIVKTMASITTKLN